MKKFRRRKKSKVPFPVSQLYFFTEVMKSQECIQGPGQMELYWMIPLKTVPDKYILAIIGVGSSKEKYAHKWFNHQVSLYNSSEDAGLTKATKAEINQITLWNDFKVVNAAVEKKLRETEIVGEWLA